jgi:hypothetical protein
MDKVLGRFKWLIALAYINDIIIYSKNFEDHIKDVDTVLSLVARSVVKLSPTKCHIGYQALQALGHQISNLGIGTADSTLEAVKNFPRPNNVKELQRFLGMCVYYRKFVKNFSTARISDPAISFSVYLDQDMSGDSTNLQLLRTINGIYI